MQKKTTKRLAVVTMIELSVFQSSAGAGDFSYIDVWSSNFTWGGGPLPQAGDFVIIPAGMTLLLDTDTPVLSFLLIQGESLDRFSNASIDSLDCSSDFVSFTAHEYSLSHIVPNTSKVRSFGFC